MSRTDLQKKQEKTNRIISRKLIYKDMTKRVDEKAKKFFERPAYK